MSTTVTQTTSKKRLIPLILSAAAATLGIAGFSLGVSGLVIASNVSADKPLEFGTHVFINASNANYYYTQSRNYLSYIPLPDINDKAATKKIITKNTINSLLDSYGKEITYLSLIHYYSEQVIHGQHSSVEIQFNNESFYQNNMLVNGAIYLDGNKLPAHDFLHSSYNVSFSINKETEEVKLCFISNSEDDNEHVDEFDVESDLFHNYSIVDNLNDLTEQNYNKDYSVDNTDDDDPYALQNFNYIYFSNTSDAFDLTKWIEQTFASFDTNSDLRATLDVHADEYEAANTKIKNSNENTLSDFISHLASAYEFNSIVGSRDPKLYYSKLIYLDILYFLASNVYNGNIITFPGIEPGLDLIQCPTVHRDIDEIFVDNQEYAIDPNANNGLALYFPRAELYFMPKPTSSIPFVYVYDKNLQSFVKTNEEIWMYHENPKKSPTHTEPHDWRKADGSKRGTDQTANTDFDFASGIVVKNVGDYNLVSGFMLDPKKPNDPWKRNTILIPSKFFSSIDFSYHSLYTLTTASGTDENKLDPIHEKNPDITNSLLYDGLTESELGALGITEPTVKVPASSDFAYLGMLTRSKDKQIVDRGNTVVLDVNDDNTIPYINNEPSPVFTVGSGIRYAKLADYFLNQDKTSASFEYEKDSTKKRVAYFPKDSQFSSSSGRTTAFKAMTHDVAVNKGTLAEVGEDDSPNAIPATYLAYPKLSTAFKDSSVVDFDLGNVLGFDVNGYTLDDMQNEIKSSCGYTTPFIQINPNVQRIVINRIFNTNFMGNMFFNLAADEYSWVNGCVPQLSQHALKEIKLPEGIVGLGFVKWSADLYKGGYSDITGFSSARNPYIYGDDGNGNSTTVNWDPDEWDDNEQSYDLTAKNILGADEPTPTKVIPQGQYLIAGSQIEKLTLPSTVKYAAAVACNNPKLTTIVIPHIYSDSSWARACWTKDLSTYTDTDPIWNITHNQDAIAYLFTENPKLRNIVIDKEVVADDALGKSNATTSASSARITRGVPRDPPHSSYENSRGTMRFTKKMLEKGIEVTATVANDNVAAAFMDNILNMIFVDNLGISDGVWTEQNEPIAATLGTTITPKVTFHLTITSSTQLPSHSFKNTQPTKDVTWTYGSQSTEE